MKYLRSSLFLLATLLSAIMIYSCTQKKDSGVSDEAEEWPEMDEFHMVMADSFHPYIDSGDLRPAKDLADEMASLAQKWASARLPGKVNNDEIRNKLKELNEATGVFKELAASGDEQQIGESLTELHNLFHDIQEYWYSGEGEHEHNHTH